MPRKPNTTGTRYNDPFPTRLRELVREREMIQEDLKDVLGVSTRQSVTGYIDGSTLPTPDKIVAVANFFGVTTDYLLGVTDSRSIDTELRTICDYTGLSDAAVARLHAGLGLPTKKYREAGYDLLDYLIVADHGIGTLIHSLVSANLGVERCMEKFEEIQKAEQSQLERFEALDKLLKDIVIDKYQINEWFGIFYDLITGYKDAKAAIEAAINQELQK